MKKQQPAIALLLALGLGGALFPAAAELKLQSSAWLMLNDDKPSTPRFGLRWQPILSLALPAGAKWKLDSEFSLDASVAGSAAGWRDTKISGKVKPYRLWLRLSSSRFEARLGLQKINFGSATVFRPLMWFDRIDPRDPLQLTDGVTGLLLRYYFKSNANAWLWGLYGNTDPKGWETLPTARHTPEFGARFQVPLFSGETAATAHFRRTAPMGDLAGPAADESRFALDGKWDLGIGVWAETSLVHQNGPMAAFPWQRSLALGLDYTFALGNGLYLLAEQFFSQGAAAPLGAAAGGLSFSALLARYPLGLLDSLNTVIYFDWRNDKMYNFASWQRTTDRWQFHVMVFWNPGQPTDVQGLSDGNMFAGRGIQLLAVWNL